MLCKKLANSPRSNTVMPFELYSIFYKSMVVLKKYWKSLICRLQVFFDFSFVSNFILNSIMYIILKIFEK